MDINASMISKDLEKKILDDLEKTGFPSEFHVRRIIASRSGRWVTSGTAGFYDLDESKLRQVDVFACMPCGDIVSRNKYTHTVWTLIIEVKKSQTGKPWVVFKEPKDPLTAVALWRQDLVNFCNLPIDWQGNFSWRVYEHSMCKGVDWVGTGIHESFKSPSDFSRPHAALMSVVKAAEHFFSNFKEFLGDMPAVTDDISKNPPKVIFTRPVVVFDGQLLAAELGADGSLKVTEIDFAPMHVGYKSANYSREKYRVDLVQLDKFDRYLESAEAQHHAIRRAILELGGLGSYSPDEIYNGAKPARGDASRSDSVETKPINES